LSEVGGIVIEVEILGVDSFAGFADGVIEPMNRPGVGVVFNYILQLVLSWLAFASVKVNVVLFLSCFKSTVFRTLDI
jgi:hypothetical protein